MWDDKSKNVLSNVKNKIRLLIRKKKGIFYGLEGRKRLS
jgi:hypothetical protein